MNSLHSIPVEHRISNEEKMAFIALHFENERRRESGNNFIWVFRQHGNHLQWAFANHPRWETIASRSITHWAQIARERGHTINQFNLVPLVQE